MAVTSRVNYNVQTSHPTKYKDGWHILTVNRQDDGTCYITGQGWGCSRDYAIPKDVDAIRTFLAEHAMQAMKVKIVHTN